MGVSASAISRVTGVAVEYKNFNAGTANMLPQRLAVVGLGSKDVSYSEKKYECSGSASEIGERYGYGSPLHLAALQLFPVTGKGASFPVTFYPQLSKESDVCATGAIKVIGTVNFTGSFRVVIGGQKITIAVSSGESASDVIAKIKDAVDQNINMPVTTGEVDIENASLTLTSKAAGTVGNLIKIIIDSSIAGLGFEITNIKDGSGDPNVSDALARFGEVWETAVLSCYPYDEASRLTAYQEFGEFRWGVLSKKPLIVFHGCTDSYEVRTAVTDVRKNDFINSLITSVGSPELPYVIAAKAMVCDILTTADNNPAQNYKGWLDGLMAGEDSAQEDYNTRNNSVNKGASTNIKTGEIAELNDIVTMYHPDSEGKYSSRRYVCDIVKLMNVIYNCRLIMESQEQKGAPLVNDDAVTSNKSAVQPKMIKASLLKLARSLEDKAIIQDVEFTKAGLEVKIDSENPKRLNTSFPVKLSGNVEVISTDIYFGFYLG